MPRSLNRVQLIGNLTRDPELRYTPTGSAVCSFGVATNRSWTTDTGEKKEETEFHRIVAWNKLAELCSQLLTKGRKVYVEGRLANRSWTGQDGVQKTSTEVVIDDMIVLDSNFKRTETQDQELENSAPVEEKQEKKEVKAKKEEPKEENQTMSSEEIADDIPF
ncbi:MAG: single-stranded DNA-binding protein [Candidatus Levyibacteriota bacterium]